MLSGNLAYFLCIIAWLTVHALSFSITQDTSLVNDETNTILVNSLNIDFDALKNNQLFPETFRVNFVANGKSYSINFGRVPKDQNYPIGSANINILESGSTKKYKIDESEDEKFELYKEFDGLSIATLIKNNQYVPGQSDEDQFRILITIFDSYLGTSEIFPVSNNQGERRKRSVQRFTYIMQTRRVEDQNLVDQKYVNLIKSKIEKKSKRAAPNGQPFNLFVEVLLVADNTIYEDHIRFAGTNDTDLVFLYMRTYFAHYFNGINQRFQNSFTNDPDLRITIKLTNFLFLTTPADSFWSDPSLVGISSVSSYRGRQVVTTNRTLEAFKNFMNSLSIPFNYDHAIGLFNKDLWEATGSNIEERSAVRGYSFVGTVCSDSRYSISEELGGFFYITVVARQIAQILGSDFDGGSDPTSSNCPSSENYLMTANIGGFSNILNQQRLSNCSILFIKNNLLENNFGAVADNAQCMINVPPNQPYDDYQNPGLFWTADDQCKMIYGPTATFCHDRNADMCLTLSCRVNSEATECTRTSGLGAAIGTVCDQGKMCSNGVCEQNLQAPLDNCVFGDDVVVNLQVIPDPLPKNQLTCQETLDYLSSIGRFPYAYCNDPNFSKTCCQTCR
ncbi:flocculation FLO11-like, partial [Brachionus plicatilis]